MKRLFSILLAGVLAAGLVGCASSGTDSAASHTPADYTAALADSRTEEDNSNYTIFTLENGGYTASKGYKYWHGLRVDVAEIYRSRCAATV